MANEEADKNAIRELLATYCFHRDNYRFTEMAALFTEDGTWDTAFGKGTGRAGIVVQAESIGTPGAARPRRVHLTTNIVIALNGDALFEDLVASIGRPAGGGPIALKCAGAGIGGGAAIPGEAAAQNKVV